MTLAYELQGRLATVQPEYKAKWCAGSFAAAVAAFGQAPNADPVKQAQRLALVNAIIRNPEYAVVPFGWVVVSRPTLNAEADVTDAFIASTITAQFDNIASQLFRGVTA